jgi:hypothetical protein
MASDRTLTADALQGGWESDAISPRFAQSSIDAYRAQGTEPQTLTDEVLRNTIVQAMGLPPGQLPSAGESTRAREARFATGLDHRYYGENAGIDAVARRGGELPPRPGRRSSPRHRCARRGHLQ